MHYNWPTAVTLVFVTEARTQSEQKQRRKAPVGFEVYLSQIRLSTTLELYYISSSFQKVLRRILRRKYNKVHKDLNAFRHHKTNAISSQ